MPSLLGNFLHTIQSRRWLSLQRKTHNLDPQTQDHLKQYLQDHLKGGAHDGQDDEDELEVEHDYETLQRAIDKLQQEQDTLLNKRDFLKTRLHAYETKLQSMEKSLREDVKKNGDGNLGDNTQENEQHLLRRAKLQDVRQKLQPIQAQYQQIQSDLDALEAKIQSMQQRQWQLKQQTLDCLVVLQELEEQQDLNYDSYHDEEGEDYVDEDVHQEHEQLSSELELTEQDAIITTTASTTNDMPRVDVEQGVVDSNSNDGQADGTSGNRNDRIRAAITMSTDPKGIIYRECIKVSQISQI
jgi:chromosome segregation ATPase